MLLMELQSDCRSPYPDTITLVESERGRLDVEVMSIHDAALIRLDRERITILRDVLNQWLTR